MSTQCIRRLISMDESLRICEAEEILSFNNFLEVKNNFHGHFYRNFMGEIYRTQSAYKKCYEANKDFRELSSQLMQYDDYSSDDSLMKLYEAYKMMCPYAETNWEMFK